MAAEQYVYVYEYYLDSNSKGINNLALNKAKLPKTTQKKYTDVFFSIMVSKITDDSICNTQILFNTPWGDNTVRKIHLRIGKISDDKILKDIYNKKSNAFENLLNYAKHSKAFYDQTLNSNADGSAGGIIKKKKAPLFSANNIVNGEYYFLYAVVDDEGGKYSKIEGVTLARGDKPMSGIAKNAFSLFFYGTDDFTWKNFTSEEEPSNNNQSSEKPSEDNTVAPGNIPQTGINNVIAVIIGIFTIVGVVSIIQYRKNNF